MERWVDPPDLHTTKTFVLYTALQYRGWACALYVQLSKMLPTLTVLCTNLGTEAHLGDDHVKPLDHCARAHLEPKLHTNVGTYKSLVHRRTYVGEHIWYV